MAYNPNNPNGQATMANSEPVVIASNQSPIAIDLAKDMFEHAVVTGRYNQIEISFDQTDPDLITDVTVTKTNGGDASNSGGQAVFTTGSNTSGGIKCVTDSTVVYRPNSEIFAEFTCIFTTGIASSYQRIGVYDTSNGFFIGYEGTSFGVTIRKVGVDTTTARASFNVDTLTGAANSKYTRNGVPETLDTTKDNLYRIRFGWLGAAPIVFEVLSPDGEWVLFHIIRHPNTTAGTSINNPDLPITLDAQKTAAGATVLTMSTACWAIGTSSDLQKVSSTLTDNTLVKPVRSVLVAKLPSGSYANIDATAGGNLKVSVEEIDPGATLAVTGTVTANAGTGTMNVSIQNASIPVTDNGGSLTVDGTIAATQSGTWSVRTQDGSGNTLTSHLAGSSRGIDVSIIDGSGNQITSFGGGTQYTEGDIDASITGTAMLWEDTSDTLRPVSAAKPLPVNIVAGSSGGTEYADGTTVATPTGTAALGWDGTAVQVVRTDSTGVLAIQDNGSSITVDGSVSVSNFPATQTVSGTVTANAGTGTFVVGDGGSSLTVDGTVAATQSGTWNIGTLTSITNTVTVSGTVTADTELATAAALSDAAANPTTSTVGAATLGFNGTTWDRLKSEGTNADAEAVSTTGSLSVCSHSEVFNGTSWDRMRAASALDGTAATSHTGVLAVLQPGKRFDPANLGTAANSTSVVDVNGSNSISIGIETTTTGTFTIEATSDGINWGSPEVFDAASDIWVSGTNITPTLGKTYQVLAGGFRSVRLRTVTTLGATVAHAFNATMSQAFIGGIDTGAAPHNFGYTLFHAEGNYATTQTSVAIRTTSAGKKFAVTDITVSTDGTTAGVVTIYDASGTTAFVAGTTPSVFRASFAPSATVKPGATKHFPVPYVSATAGNNILVTITGITASYIQINGYEI